MSIDLSIVILSFNTKDLTKECIDSVYKYTKGVSFELIVVDNASTDGSQKLLEKYKNKSNFTLIKNTKNIGFGLGNNQGIKISKGKFVLLLNSDTLLLEDSISKVHKFMHNESKSGIASCNLKNVDGANQSNGGYFPTLPRVFLWMTFLDDIPIINSVMKSFHPKPIVSTKPIELDWVMGSFFMIRREVVDLVGYFDSDYFMYTEEVDFCYRTKKKGFGIWFVPSTSILHYGGASSSTEFAIINEFKGIKTFYTKHMSKLSQFALRMFLFFGINLRIFIYSLSNSDKSIIYKNSRNYI